MLKRIFIAIWHDPVGSKVISGIILIPIAAVVTGLWSGSGFSLNGTAIWAGAKSAAISFIIWTATPLPISRAWLFIIVCLGVIGWGCAALLWLYSVKRRFESLNADEVPTRFYGGATAPPSPPDPKTMSVRNVEILKLLYGVYPQRLALHAVAEAARLRYPEVEQLCERMAESDLVKVMQGDFGLSALLTKSGRNYYIDNGFDLAE